jgi:hypothetical protein
MRYTGGCGNGRSGVRKKKADNQEIANNQ